MERIGFVGLGTMGAAMAANIVRGGFPLTVWNRSPGKAAPLVALGAREATSPAAVGRASDIVLICVSDSPDVEAVVLGPGGLAEGLAAGALVVDCSTISPATSRRIAAHLRRLGVAFLDAPVSGGSEGARDATLTIFVGGEAADVERARPVLERIGRTITHVGPVGAGQVTKAVNQVMIAGAYLSVAEGIVLAIRAGLDPATVVAALSGGAARSWVLENRSGRMIANDYPLGFRVALHRKDLAIALELARQVGVALPVAAWCEQVETALVATGHGDEDVSAVARTLRSLAGLD
jgi:3-hydroxyisobutyrate dehydrogenase